jgi:hypothetical protein
MFTKCYAPRAFKVMYLNHFRRIDCACKKNKLFFVVARNFRILHPTNEDAASGQILHFATMPGAEHCNINYSVGCFGTPYCHIHSQSILY